MRSPDKPNAVPIWAYDRPRDRKLITRRFRAVTHSGGSLLTRIAARLVMLQSGMRSPMGVKVFGNSLAEIEAAGFKQIGEGNFWRNPADTHDFPSYKPNMPVDNFVLKFQKPM